MKSIEKGFVIAEKKVSRMLKKENCFFLYKILNRKKKTIGGDGKYSNKR